MAGFLALVAAASVACNAYLAQLSHRYFKDTVAVRLDPAGLHFYEAERRPREEARRPVLVFFGDSRALMWTSPAALTEYRVVNRGIGNQTTAQVLLRLDADLV
ncbi:MAG: SGNH/GDSL hydrolase family protein, partial [Myxococcota bacterium]|nr:SGNH/GDSL hydrolase family protein [Myxococcota bacterium]